MSEGFLTPGPLADLDIYDPTIHPNQSLKSGAIFFSDAYSPVEHYDDANDFAAAIAGYNSNNGLNLDPQEEYTTKLDGPNTCEEAKTKLTCCAVDACVVLDQDECLGQSELPVGTLSMKTCQLQHDQINKPCDPPETWVDTLSGKQDVTGPIITAPEGAMPGLAPGDNSAGLGP